MIKREIVNAIIDAARIEEVVGDFVTLKKRGANMLGLCPFHNEKTPSFTVSPAKGIYKCFGCGKAGSAVHFIMEHEHYSYPEALKYLARKYNITIEETERTPEEILLDDTKDRLFNINSFAQQYFSEILFENKSGRDIGLSYFKERGFIENTIKTFQLGYSLDEFDAFVKHAKHNGYKEDIISKSGLVTTHDDGKIFDRFRGRVIFPIHNLSGRVIGFGGRIMSADKSKAKYINSPETEIYHKSDTLYGIFFAKSAIVSHDLCYLVEGYTDVISMFQSGFKNVVASSGTSLTIEQIRLIKRFTHNITIIYDGDEAGLKASLRGIDMILEEGLNVRIIPLPEKEDPDSFVRNNPSSEVDNYFKNKAQDFIRFKTELLLKETNNDPLKKAEVIKDVVNSISLIPDAINRAVYVQECARLLDIKEQTLITEINKLIRKSFNKKNRSETEEDTSPEILPVEKPDSINKTLLVKDGIEYLERSLIEKLILYGKHTADYYFDGENEAEAVSTAEFIVNEIKYDNLEFSDAICKKIFELFEEEMKQENIPDEKFFINHPDSEIALNAISFIANPYSVSENWKDYNVRIKKESDDILNTVCRTIYSLKAAYIKKLRAEIQEKMKSADEDELLSLMLKDKEYKEQEMVINNFLNRIIT
ncbi:DNA primase [Odoribacter sp. OttesenSCG-928-L07]|nr:DNA primase [Odoribacter sp. OttesenSCG-928-L07]MDL2239862.1 DNA primase [Bacteroidales bacterium OttesenSCG-928-L14]MDL2241198.1 DNA primase [Bacteroidales bacterium OttesenSCG-928-K22]